MKPLPLDPLARRDLAFAYLLTDISDPKATGFPRLDALHATNKVRADISCSHPSGQAAPRLVAPRIDQGRKGGDE
jgi:hypothetical protein